jgi:hypothetical protein
MGRIALIAAAALFAGGIGMHPAYPQSGTAPKADKAEKAEKADKQKSTEKKNTAKQNGTQQTGSTQSAPMSGFRPDPQTNY